MVTFKKVFIQHQLPSSPAALERSGITVRWSLLIQHNMKQ